MSIAESLTVSVAGRLTTASAYRAAADGRIGATLVLAHGAGAGQTHPFMVKFAAGLAARGVDVVTFNFLYTEQKRKVPDRTEVLEECFRAVIAAARSDAPGNRIFIGGKSMGGRMASHLAAGEPDKARPTGGQAIAGLVLLGYPLHPPGKPEQLRIAHLPKIRVPVLIVQGERDSFGTPEELKPHLASIPAPVTLHVVERGDHSLAVPKSSGRSIDEVYSDVQDLIANWIIRLRG